MKTIAGLQIPGNGPCYTWHFTMHLIPVFPWLQNQQNSQMLHGCLFKRLKEAFVSCYKTSNRFQEDTPAFRSVFEKLTRWVRPSILLKLLLQDINNSLSKDLNERFLSRNSCLQVLQEVSYRLQIVDLRATLFSCII